MKRSILSALLLLAPLAAAAPAAAEDYIWRLSALGTLGGSLDLEPDAGFDRSGYQLGLGMVVETGTQVVLRAGKLAFDDEAGFGSLAEADLEYVTVSGEYRFHSALYDFGFFGGLGGYQVRGEFPDGASQKESTLGVTAGVSGEFRLIRHLALLVEVAAHYAPLDEADLFAFAGAGLQVQF